MHTLSTSSWIPSNTDTTAHHDHDMSNVIHTAELLTYAGGCVLDQLSADLGEHTTRCLCLRYALHH